MSHGIRDEISNNVLHFFRQIFYRLLTNVLGNAPSGFGYTAYDSSKCVGIGTERNGSTSLPTHCQSCYMVSGHRS